jgi:hypothetical protein
MEIRSKNLLITIGDSWTQGVGCYLPELIDSRGNPTGIAQQVYLQSVNRFSQYGWPNICAKNLDYDLLNYGTGGFSNSSAAKTLIDGNNEIWREYYERVTVIFLLSDSLRFGLYSNGNLMNYGTRGFIVKQNDIIEHKWNIDNGLDSFMEWYIHSVDIDDASKETAFYLRAVEYFCKACNYDFYWGTAFTKITEVTPHYKNKDNCLHMNNFSSFMEYVFKKLGPSGFSYCHHPSENGHRLIGEFIANQLRMKNK